MNQPGSPFVPAVPAPRLVPPPGMMMGQVLERTFALLRAHFRMLFTLALIPGCTFLGFIVLLGGAAALLILPHMHDLPDLPDLWALIWLVPLGLLFMIGTFVVGALYIAAASYAAVQAHRGIPVTVSEAWAIACRRGKRHVWLMFLCALLVAGPVYLLFGIMGGGAALMGAFADRSSAPNPAFFMVMPLLFPLILAGYVYMAFMFLRYCLAFPASVIEDLPAVPAIKRSVALTHGGKGRIFVVMLVMYAATYAVILGLEIALGLLAAVGMMIAALAQLTLHSPLVLFLLVPLGLLVAIAVLLIIIALPYSAYMTALGVLYCDQKQRFDAAAAALAAPSPLA